MAKALLKPDTNFPNGSTLMQRLGILCWWFGAGAAALSVLIGTGNAIAEGSHEWSLSIGVGLGFGAFFWLFGRASLFLFAGR